MSTETPEIPQACITEFVEKSIAEGLQRVNSALDAKVAELTARIAELEAEVAAKQKTIKQACEDWADDDTRVKEIAAQFGIKECHDNHDAFKGVIEIAEEMAALLAEARKDSARLDWIENEAGRAWPFGNQFDVKFTCRSKEPFKERPSIRAAIDAAMLPATPLPETKEGQL